MKDWIVTALSAEQKLPFSATGDHASILAAAGSGKTRTLIHLLANDLSSGIPASGIIAFTFTEKAAEELLARIHLLGKEKMPDVDLSGIFIGTIHSWCLQYLYSQADFYNITPIDELHFDALVGRLYDALDLQAIYNEPFPRAIEPFLADLEVFYNEHLSLAQVPDRIRPALTAFTEMLAVNRLLTFGGMIRLATEHLQKSGPVAELRSLYVDEYQDVNPAQTALVKAMVPASGKIRVVGDDLQSIYNWRGSDVTRILEFPNEFAPAEVFRLSTNYRSRPEIVRIANCVAEDVVLKDPVKVMLAGRQPSGSKEVQWVSTCDELQQAETIVEIVKQFNQNGVPYSKIAILLRSVLRAGPPIYQALQAANIPVECPILSRGGAFINQFLLPVLGWLRTEQQAPKSEQDEQKQIANAQSVWDSVAPWLSIENAEGIFWETLNLWHDHLREKKNTSYNVRSCLYDFLDACGIRLAPSDTGLMVGIGIASQIIRSVEEIHRRRIQGHARRTPVGVINEVYYALIRKQEDFGESLPINQETQGVILTTVHQAKGLEWPVVIVPMLVRRRFPLQSQPAKSSFPPEVVLRYGTSIDDERRLFYVAVTRARERLFLMDTTATAPQAASQFLKDLKRTAKIAPSLLSPPSDPNWSIASEDLTDGGHAPLRIGLSDLLLYLECPYQFGLRRISGLQPSVGDELGFGKGLHELIQRRTESDHAWSKDELTAETDAHVHLPLTSEQSEMQAKGAIVERITELEKLGAFDGNLQQELQVEVFLGDGVVTGIIDCIYTCADGSLIVRDWKANVHQEFIMRYARQLQFYVYALRAQNKAVSGAELVDVAASTKTKKLVTTAIDISEATIASLIDDCQQALQAIRSAQFQPTPSVAVCGSCDMRRICAEREG